MYDLFKCVCEFSDNHYWLPCFLKQVLFIVKRISAKPMLYDADHIQFYDEATKTAIWKDIAHDYKGEFTKSDSSDDQCDDGCRIKLTQKSLQNQLARIVKFLRQQPSAEQRGQLDLAKMDIIDRAVTETDVTDSGLIDFLHNVSFILECIVANPSLYDRKNSRYLDDRYKLTIWNGMCNVFHDKVQSNDFDLGDEDLDFEIKHTQRTIERLVHRIANPLCMGVSAGEGTQKTMTIDLGDSSDSEHGEQARDGDTKRPLTINIAPSKTGSQTVNIIVGDGSDGGTLQQTKWKRECVRAQTTKKYRKRSLETSKHKQSNIDSDCEPNINSEAGSGSEASQPKKSRVDDSPSNERPVLLKSAIQVRKDEPVKSHKTHNTRRK